MTTYNVVVITVSDTASKDSSMDKSGPLLKDLLVQQKHFTIAGSCIIPDDEQTIQTVVKSWLSPEINWIITTGGTGFGVRDRTPESIKSIIDKEAPGIVHLLLSSSLRHTPLAALSRPIAGSVGNTLIVTLPGSTKAVRENLTALLDAGIVPHALDLLKGGSGKQVHSELARATQGEAAPSNEGEQRHNHHHHHHHHRGHQLPQPRTSQVQDVNFPASSRNRVSPYPLISYVKAMEIILRETPGLGSQTRRVSPSLKGHILSESVYAHYDIPRTRSTNVDGYALRSTDPPGVYRVVTPQSHKSGNQLDPDAIFRINTGAPLPEGADSVIMVEDTQLVSTCENNPDEEKEVRTLVQVPEGENVRAPGSDVRNGELVLMKGTMLSGTGGEIGTLAFVGQREVSVYRKPTVAILSTGNELVDIGDKSDLSSETHENWTGIWDTNRPTLQAALETLGYSVVDLGIVHDNISAHVERLRLGLHDADIVITTGGTSMGASDLLKPVIEKYLDGTIHFGRVTIKPGKPTTFATIPYRGGSDTSDTTIKPIFALPGNPASALVCFYIFLVPALRKMGGWKAEACQMPRIRVRLGDNMRLDTRTEFHRVVIISTSDGLIARSTGGQRSSRTTSLSGANGLVILPQKTDGSPVELKAGEYADALLIGEI